jgi:hypothetical protein
MDGRIELVKAADSQEDDDLLHLAGQPPVRVRELGPRALDDVPVEEIAELMRRLRAAGAEGDLRRAVLDRYGLVRLTTKAEEYLGRALALAAVE